MNMLFYYEELYNTAAERINQLVDISVMHRNTLLQRLREQTPSLLITTADIDLVAQRIMASVGAVLCPQAAAEYAGVSKLLEMEMEEWPE
ncbi:hypothetical protein [Chitinophaga nivalis]|uniref:Uncharacterized protein n=1 Tax=Chitinophaga nivalis TaxID=2991709 RepID=A0ABT3IKN7_9BACT|nr:hypothetical protein [Chitinophaga nivalis]MCW3465794.1 hypothetical protein [Chitinophaga nivalis]MCW3484515.1 hypothetical protein [Chitinophaga nivalis]